MADAAQKNRIAHGERAGPSRLTDAEVAEVRRLGAKGLTHQAIADKIGVARSHVTNIINRRVRQRDTTVYPDG